VGEFFQGINNFFKKYIYARERLIAYPFLITLTFKMQYSYHLYIFYVLVFFWLASKIKTNSAFNKLYTDYTDKRFLESIKNISCDEYNLKKPRYDATYANSFEKYITQGRGWLITAIASCLYNLAMIFFLFLIYWELFVCKNPPLSYPVYAIVIIAILCVIARFIQNIDDANLDAFLFWIPFAIMLSVSLLYPLYSIHIWSPGFAAKLRWIEDATRIQINIYVTVYIIYFTYLTFFCRYLTHALKKNRALSDDGIYDFIFYSPLPRITMFLLLCISIISLTDCLFFYEYIDYRIFIDSDILNTFSNYNKRGRVYYYRVGYLTTERYQLLITTHICIFILVYFRRFKNGYKTYYEILKNDYISLYDSIGATVACYYMIERSYLVYGKGVLYDINLVEAACCLCVPVSLYVHILYILIFLEKFFKNNDVIIISFYNLLCTIMFIFFKKYRLLVNPEYNWKIINSLFYSFYYKKSGRSNYCWLTNGKILRNGRTYWEYHTITIWCCMLLSIFNLKCFICIVFNNEHTPLLDLLDEAIWLLLSDMYVFIYKCAFPFFILDNYFLNRFTINLINALLKYIEIIIFKKTWESNSTIKYPGKKIPLIFLSKHYGGIITLLFIFIVMITQTYVHIDLQPFFEWAGLTVNSKYAVAFYELINWIINF